MNQSEKLFPWMIWLLRVATGWHFLYEGLVKLYNPGWTAASYLANANWIFSDWFHLLARSNDVLQVVNFLNIWGLILIGTGLMLGIGIRIASIGGILLLMLYYMANPSLIGAKYHSVSSEGSYLFINKNIIEALVLLVVAVYPAGKHIGLSGMASRVLKIFGLRLKTVQTSCSDIRTESRRMLLRNLAVLPVAGLFSLAFIKKRNSTAADAFTGATTLFTPDKAIAEQARDKIFHAKIGNMDISRLILGGGCLAGWQHARDLKYVNELASKYNNRQRILETLKLAESSGINAANVYASQLHILHDYNNNYSGKLSTIVGVAINADDWVSEVDKVMALGAGLVYIQPAVSDRLVKFSEIYLLEKAIAYIRSKNLPAGIGCHSVKVIEECTAVGITPDFYVKTIHPDTYWSANPVGNRFEFDPSMQKFYPDHNKYHDNIFDLFPERTIDLMKDVKCPWIGFKTLASGALTPGDGFRFAFEGGADFVSIGMFDFQIEKNVKTALEVLRSDLQRTRKWSS